MIQALSYSSLAHDRAALRRAGFMTGLRQLVARLNAQGTQTATLRSVPGRRDK